jgi:hypothetical protein
MAERGNGVVGDFIESLFVDFIVQLIISYGSYSLGISPSIFFFLTSNWLVVSFAAVGVVTYLVLRRRRAIYQMDGGYQDGVTDFIPEMNALICKYEIERYKVKWVAYIGFQDSLYLMEWQLQGGKMPFPYVHGPFCPKHDVKLRNEFRPKFLVLKRGVWVCNVEEREEKYYMDPKANGKEADVVRQMALARFNKEYQLGPSCTPCQ